MSAAEPTRLPTEAEIAAYDADPSKWTAKARGETVPLRYVRPLTYRPTLLACFAGTLAQHERFRSLAHLDGG